jgi:hypothetical protein
MDTSLTTLSHDEISLLLFALQGDAAAAVLDASSCEEACPVVESVEELLCGGKIDSEMQLIRHLNNHLREALIDSGMFELMAATHPGAGHTESNEAPAQLRQINDRLAEWTCQIKLDDLDRQLLSDSLSRLPRSSWVTMPRMMWRLRKKLKAR